MLYLFIADIVVFVHLLWILFLVTGAYWAVKHSAVMIVHGGGLFFAIISQVFGWYCPLTHLEVWLRRRYDQALSYPGSFIAHYTEKFIYLEVSGRIIFIMTLALVVINAILYARILSRQRT